MDVIIQGRHIAYSANQHSDSLIDIFLKISCRQARDYPVLRWIGSKVYSDSRYLTDTEELRKSRYGARLPSSVNAFEFGSCIGIQWSRYDHPGFCLYIRNKETGGNYSSVLLLVDIWLVQGPSDNTDRSYECVNYAGLAIRLGMTCVSHGWSNSLYPSGFRAFAAPFLFLFLFLFLFFFLTPGNQQ